MISSFLIVLKRSSLDTNSSSFSQSGRGCCKYENEHLRNKSQLDKGRQDVEAIVQKQCAKPKWLLCCSAPEGQDWCFRSLGFNCSKPGEGLFSHVGAAAYSRVKNIVKW